MTQLLRKVKESQPLAVNTKVMNTSQITKKATDSDHPTLNDSATVQ